MGIKRAFLKLLRLGVVVYAATLFAVIGWSFLWPRSELAQVSHVETIVCLGAGHYDDGRIGRKSEQRAKTCADLHILQPETPIVFTGISAVNKTVAEMMAEVARESGVPNQYIVEENEARSTLQNALFSLPYLDATAPVALVTDSFHLPRSYVSFRWAGYEDLTLIAAQSRQGERWIWPGPKSLLSEPLKIYFNLIRGGLWTLANRFGVENTAWLM